MALGAAARPTGALDRRPSAGQLYFERLMSLTLRHDFYDGGLCDDFVIVPTAPTRALMHNLGLIARPRRAGIDIIYHTGQSAAIVHYLRDRLLRRSRESRSYSKASTHSGSWSRLSFTLRPTNECFTTITAMPWTARPGKHALYLSNRYVTQAEDQPAQLIADWEEYGVDTPEITFAPENIHFEVPREAAEFTLYDTSGRAILRACESYGPDDRAPSEIPLRMHLTPGADLHVSMANEWPGLFGYEIRDVRQRVIRRHTFFYCGVPTAALFFVDLYLANPTPGRSTPSGCYPIALPDAAEPTPEAIGDALRPRDYELRFKARETTWIYYIAASSIASLPNDLAIRSEPEDRLRFDGPVELTLPQGKVAQRFIARKAEPLRRRSDVVLRLLSGAVNGNGRTLLERLPTPSAERVGPSESSEVFVYL